VVFDPRRRLMVEMVPCEDAHAQERALIGALFELVKGGELWMADRNFCTTLMLRGLINRGAFFLIRQHASTLYLEKGGPWRKCGACKSGTVYEQSVPVRLDLCSGREQWVTLRRIKLKLKKPTEDGDWEIHLLSNLPQSARAEKLAQLYADRWQIEDAFGELTASLRCEINTLGYPARRCSPSPCAAGVQRGVADQDGVDPGAWRRRAGRGEDLVLSTLTRSGGNQPRHGSSGGREAMEALHRYDRAAIRPGG